MRSAPAGANACRIRSKNSSGWASSRYLRFRSPTCRRWYSDHRVRVVAQDDLDAAPVPRSDVAPGARPERRVQVVQRPVERGGVPGRLPEDGEAWIGGRGGGVQAAQGERQVAGQRVAADERPRVGVGDDRVGPVAERQGQPPVPPHVAHVDPCDAPGGRPAASTATWAVGSKP